MTLAASRPILRRISTLALASVFFWSGAASALAASCCNCHPAGNASVNVCLTDTTAVCAGNDIIQKSNNTSLTGYVCDDIPLDPGSACKPVSAGGSAKCAQGPTDATSYKPPAVASSTQGTYEFKALVPVLNVPIPGLTFASQFGLTNVNGQQAVSVPIFAQYISAIYRYLLAISVLAAAIMIIYGGFRYILGTTLSSTSAGKTIVRDAIIGLIILFSAYTILQVVNPATLQLQSVNLTLIKPDPINSYLGAAQDAPITLSEIGIKPRNNGIPGNEIAQNGVLGQATQNDVELIPPPAVSTFPTNLTIPMNCPGRNAGSDPPSSPDPVAAKKSGDTAHWVVLGNTYVYPKTRLAIPLSQDAIKQYLVEQSRTGVPAGVLIAQMLTESWNKCVIENLFKDPKSCGSGLDIQNYNFGGIGCSASQVADGVCPNVAFAPGFNVKNKSETFGNAGCDDPSGGPNVTFNKYLAVCTNTCRTANRSDANYNCGPNCYPQPSHAAAVVNGTEVWYPSIQCSRKFSSAQQFLDSHLGFARYCLPYNDSVYKFAYCIGASTYAGVTGDKGPLLADIIERNCLCGSKDSSKCVRDKSLEKGLSTNVIKKRNLTLFSNTCEQYSASGKCLKYTAGAGPDYDAIIKALQDSTKGALSPRAFPQNDILPPDNVQ